MNATTSMLVSEDGSVTTIVVSTSSLTMQTRFLGGPGRVRRASAKNCRVWNAVRHLVELADRAEQDQRVMVAVAGDVAPGVTVCAGICAYVSGDRSTTIVRELRRCAEHLRSHGFPPLGGQITIGLDDNARADATTGQEVTP